MKVYNLFSEKSEKISNYVFGVVFVVGGMYFGYQLLSVVFK